MSPGPMFAAGWLKLPIRGRAGSRLFRALRPNSVRGAIGLGGVAAEVHLEMLVT